MLQLYRRPSVLYKCVIGRSRGQTEGSVTAGSHSGTYFRIGAADLKRQENFNPNSLQRCFILNELEQ